MNAVKKLSDEMQSEERRTFLDLALFGLLAEIHNIESCKQILTDQDRHQIEMATLQLMELAAKRNAA